MNTKKTRDVDCYQSRFICLRSGRLSAVVGANDLFQSFNMKAQYIFASYLYYITYNVLISVAVLYQKRLKKERKARRRLQDQLELEMKRRQQLEEALKNSGAPPEALRILNGGCLHPSIAISSKFNFPSFFYYEQF